jgi:hypothetical protein
MAGEFCWITVIGRLIFLREDGYDEWTKLSLVAVFAVWVLTGHNSHSRAITSIYISPKQHISIDTDMITYHRSPCHDDV